MLIDGLDLGTRFREVTPASDAVLLVGVSGSSAGSLAVSSTNSFDELISGVTLTVKKASSEEVTVDIATTSEPVYTQMKLLVEQYNKLRDKLDQVTAYDETAKTTGLLFGSSEALRLESDLSRLITTRFSYTGPVQSMEDVGFSLDDKGKLSFDKTQFEKKVREAPEAVEKFFTQEETGVTARFSRITEQLAGRGNSVLMNRVSALQKTHRQQYAAHRRHERLAGTRAREAAQPVLQSRDHRRFAPGQPHRHREYPVHQADQLQQELTVRELHMRVMILRHAERTETETTQSNTAARGDDCTFFTAYCSLSISPADLGTSGQAHQASA